MKIFRKTRQKFLAKNEFRNYFIYAIGEIVLVVIGILIALQINNWNQAKKDNRALNEYLVKIKSHTKEDLYKLDSISRGRTRIAELCKKARTSILDKTEDENLILFMSSGFAFADLNFKPSTGGYEALQNSDYFGKINNTPLDSLLTSYHSLIDEIAASESSYNDFAKSQQAYLSTQFDRSLMLASVFVSPDSLAIRATTQAEYFEDFAAYTSAAPYRNVISLAAWQFDTMVDLYDKLKDLGENVIEEIDAITND